MDERIVAEITKENPVNQITMEKVFALANSGVAPAKKVVDNLVVALHKGIHNYINLLAPDIIILGGGISKGLAGLEKQIINGDYLLPFTSYKVSLVISDLQEQAGILGAASLFKLKEKHL
jgi:glucokinase